LADFLSRSRRIVAIGMLRYPNKKHITAANDQLNAALKAKSGGNCNG
jgi:hypothetical protein